jgi:hypothetical protein
MARKGRRNVKVQRPHDWVQPKPLFTILTAALLATGCATPQHYRAAVRPEVRSGAPSVIWVTVGPLEYGTNEFVPDGWFAVTPIPVVLENPTDYPVLVDWDRSALVSPSGETLSIIHSGVSLADAKSGNYRTYQKKSLIAPHAKLSDVMIPVGWVNSNANQWFILFRPAPHLKFIAVMNFDIGSKNMTLSYPFTIDDDACGSRIDGRGFNAVAELCQSNPTRGATEGQRARTKAARTQKGFT